MRSVLKLFRKRLFLTCLLTASVSIDASAPSAPPAPAALHPIIAPDGVLMGAVQKGQWLPQEKAARLLKGGEAYYLYTASSPLSIIRGGKPKSMDAPCPDQMFVDTPLPTGMVIGIGGAWNALPRRQQIENVDQTVYRTAVKNVLIAHGIGRPDVHIDQILRCDLDKDGSDEVLISAHLHTSTDHGVTAMPAGGYSLILMRKLTHGHLKTSLVVGDFYPKPRAMSTPLTYHIDGLYDLTGDGRMQIVVGWRYYEGSGTDVYAVNGDGVKQVLTSGCGA